MYRVVPLVIAGVLATGCASTYMQNRPAQYYDETPRQEAAAGSLFASDASLLSDADIERILGYKYAPPALSRVAILPFGWQRWSGWSEQMAITTDEINQKLIRKLRSAPSIYDASFMPSILIPDTRTVPYIREAAARYQADLVLVFRSSCQSFEKYRFFAANEAKAYCSVESVLLDVRTGLVPFVAVATQSYKTEEQAGDTNFRETQLRSQLSAAADALGEVAERTVEFLSRAGNEAS